MSSSINTDTLSLRETWLALQISETRLLQLVESGAITPKKDETGSRMHWLFNRADVLALKERL